MQSNEKEQTKPTRNHQTIEKNTCVTFKKETQSQVKFPMNDNSALNNKKIKMKKVM